MSDADFVVFLVDDDPGVLKALSEMLRLKGFEVRSFSSANQFLIEHDPSVPGCAILDVSMPDLDGLRLQAMLAAQDVDRPIIFITGVAEVPESVKAMKAGAIDFLIKPVRSKELLAAIESARAKEREARHRRSELNIVNSRLTKLTPREREVLNSVVTGMLNKQIAVAEKTVKLHRGRMMKKMGVRSVAELVRIADQVAK